MRKKEKEIKDKATIESILRKAEVCHLGFCAGELTYVVPVNFGYRDGRIYVHSSHKGMKISMLKRNSRVCFQVETDVRFAPGSEPCDWGVHYRSVIGFGRASLVEDYDEKVLGLNALMEHYTGRGDHQFPKEKVDRAAIIRIDVESMTGKREG